MPKLTLSVNEEVLEQAKRLAQENGTSVSAMFCQFVRAMAQQAGRARPRGPLTRKASGLAALPKNKTCRSVLEEALLDKYALEP